MIRELDSQLKELSKGDKTNISPNRYKLSPKRKRGSLTFLIILPEKRSLLKM
jgi:hypothetical protein